MLVDDSAKTLDGPTQICFKSKAPAKICDQCGLGVELLL
jgi:hypothetical protein